MENKKINMSFLISTKPSPSPLRRGVVLYHTFADRIG
jgi:hypothetical protein